MTGEDTSISAIHAGQRVGHARAIVATYTTTVFIQNLFAAETFSRATPPRPVCVGSGSCSERPDRPVVGGVYLFVRPG
jgi:hypothetical protein